MTLRLDLRDIEYLAKNFEDYAEGHLFIRTKAGSVKPFILNRVQQYIHRCLETQKAKTGKVRALILKGRQQGCSTYVSGRYFWLATHNIGYRVFILTHAADATQNLFSMTQRYLDNCPEDNKPLVDTQNKNELSFKDVDSDYKVGTAGAEAVGRSNTIHLFHGSEVAFWPNAETHAAGVIQAVSKEPGTEIILESTANGMGNFFHKKVQEALSGDSEYIFIFIPWFWQEEYRENLPEQFELSEEEVEYKKLYDLDDQQIYWRRLKVKELGSSWLFKQEYPATPQEAFQTSGIESFISPESIMKARVRVVDTVRAGLRVGLDPARFGNDATSFAFREGRVCDRITSYYKKSLMEVVGLAKNIIVELRPIMMFIDTAGLGAGVYDRLEEMGYGDFIMSVNGGEKADDPEKFFNKRAEMSARLKEWILLPNTKIPDSDNLHMELAGPTYSYDSNGRLKIEKKEDMKKRGLHSPNEADALSLTFAYDINETALQQKRRREEDGLPQQNNRAKAIYIFE